MKRNVTTAVILVFSSFMSMGAFCSPEPTTSPAPPPQQDPGVSPELFKRTYEITLPMIKDTFSKIDLQEADYQDWLTRVDEKGKQSAMFTTVSKRHEEIMAANTAAKAKFDGLGAYYEAHKDAPRLEDNTKLANDGQSLMQETNKILTDLHGLKSYMMQIKP